MNFKTTILVAATTMCCFTAIKAQKTNKRTTIVKKALSQPKIDGFANEVAWQNADWQQIDQRWDGPKFKDIDFKGRYKVTWNQNALFIYVETQDDRVMDINKDPLNNYYQDDSIILFIDEDNSGGEHTFTHNAFAYHLSLKGDIVDLSTKRTPKRFNHHVQSIHRQVGNKSFWEIKAYVFNSRYKENRDNKPVRLKVGKKIGFAVGYNDLDDGQERENIIGSEEIPGKDKNVAYKDANVFGTIILKN